MTEKRFNFVGGYLYDFDNCIGHVEDVKFRQDYEDIVNALHEENEQLKKENRELEKFRYSVFKNLYEITEKEHRE